MSTSSSSAVALAAGAATTDSGKESTIFDFTDSSLEQVEGRSRAKVRTDQRRNPSLVRTQFSKQRVQQETSHTPKSRSLSAARQKDPSAASSSQPPADEAMPISALVKQPQLPPSALQLPPSVPTTSSSGSTWHTLEDPTGVRQSAPNLAVLRDRSLSWEQRMAAMLSMG